MRFYENQLCADEKMLIVRNSNNTEKYKGESKKKLP
jgi:hypothetical protein